MTNWSGEQYSQVSGLQRAVAARALDGVALEGNEHVLDVGCGDGFITREIAGMVPHGFVTGVDVSPDMIAAADSFPGKMQSGPRFVQADARHLPFADEFDVVVSFNALHWVPQQREALAQIAKAVRPGGRVVIQVVCASERLSVEAAAMQVCRSQRWASRYEGFIAPFIHVNPASYGDLAASAGLTLDDVSTSDLEWDFGTRADFTSWCTVGTTAWTDRLDAADKPAFIEELVLSYETVSERPGLFLFTQMRAELHRAN